MISLILPYWDRKLAAYVALRRLAEMYHDLDLEVVVVDDGNPEPFEPPQTSLNINVVRLPTKYEPLCPVTCWNHGVEVAKGDVIALSCIEVLHTDPVLAQMASELERLGPDGYVLSAAWCPESREWHCHSQHRASGSYPIPVGTGRAFLAMLNRSLFEKTGGFDDEYRGGAGYEDVDWIYRLIKAGAKFSMRDDLVVTHPKSGATIRWSSEKFERNHNLLKGKWPC